MNPDGRHLVVMVHYGQSSGQGTIASTSVLYIPVGQRPPDVLTPGAGCRCRQTVVLDRMALHHSDIVRKLEVD